MQGIQRIADKGFVYPSSCSFLYRMAEEESKSLQRHLDNLHISDIVLKHMNSNDNNNYIIL